MRRTERSIRTLKELDLKANASVDCKGTVIDSKLDKGLGPVATVLIQKGTLKIGIPFICNNHPGKVRAIMNEKGERIKEAGPSDAVQILGFDQVPQSGDILAEVTNESDLKKIANDRQRIKREIDLQMVQKKSGIMDVCFRDIQIGRAHV